MEGGKSTAEAMKNLEAIYEGIPDESVDLTFKYLTTMPQNEACEKKKAAMTPIKDNSDQNSRQTSSQQGSRSGDHSRRAEAEIKGDRLARRGSGRGFVASLESVVASLESVVVSTSSFEAGGGQCQRQGTPHSNICALCDLYIYICRHRCLVCGRVYCKKCVRKGMGEMIEGRKCTECLGRRFSQRYIKRAGKSGCCCGYPSRVKKQELIWAEKGVSRSGEEKYERNFLDGNPLILPARSPRPSAGNGPAYILTASASFSSKHGFPLEGQ